ncbi:CpsD/CapB family tyrosine-protein kinase [Microvirga terricola]|uniref:CpsD/CapB family tyrosine-protein kinase n=1 Tax=Microvirga terricola TaxID=2719797 RepID=A0ABX0VBA4_9HYPH|nr:CpsD/CapB family tyrosine-protein kinase [Microvirga terricola]NIX75676.1 CpsD/CapB family tyrosine-protein kinase [Microvirga terricola]
MERTQAAAEKSEREKSLFAFPEASASPRATGDDVWAKLAPLNLDKKRIAQRRIVTFDRSDNASVAFDILRTKVLKTLRQNNWTSVAITSPTQGCGKTHVALNLAFSFASLKDFRTVLVDLDLRRPQVGQTLGIEKGYSMERFLKGTSSVEETFVRYENNLAVGANGQPVCYAAELLQSPDTPPILTNLRDRLKPDILLFDLPPMLANDDVLAFLPNVDCVVLIAAAEASTLGEIDICERSLSKESNFLGVVLNKCQYRLEEHGY